MKKNVIMNICIILIFIISTINYIGTVLEWKNFSVDIVEKCVYIFGFILTDITLISCIFKKKLSMILAVICMGIRFIYDIFSFFIDGNILSGTFNMDIFILVDIVLIAIPILAMYKKQKFIYIISIIISIIYALGEILGYPFCRFSDWCEFFMIIELTAVYIYNFSLIGSKNGKSKKI